MAGKSKFTPEERLQKKRDWYHANQTEERRLKALATAKEHYRANRERHLANVKARAEKKREEIRAYKKQWRRKNLSSLVAKAREWRASSTPEQRAKRSATSADYRKNHPAKYAMHAQKRRAIKMARTVEPKQIEAWATRIRSSKEVRCYYCDGIIPADSVHIDHVVPLSREGRHSIENLCASCPKCNLTKNDTPLQNWRRVGQQVLPL